MNIKWSDLKNIQTPAYIYNIKEIKNRCMLLQNSLSNKIELFYSEKANPNLSLLDKIKNYVKGIEVASKRELENALETGFLPENIIFVGPGKTYDEIKYAIKNNIYNIICESDLELEIVNEIGRKMKKKIKCSIRINPISNIKGNRMKMGGASKPFGIDEEKIPITIKIAKKYNFINIIGFYIYRGTQNLDIESICMGYEETFKFALKYQKILNHSIEFIGLGGGYGIPYFEGDKELDMNLLEKKINSILNLYVHKFSNSVRIISESGRYIVATSGKFITKILYKKKSRKKIFLIVDGGTNFFSISSGMGCFLKRNFPFSIVQKNENLLTELATIVGPLCTPTDQLTYNQNIPISEVGDFVIFENAGAYGLTASPVLLLSHELPKEILIEKE